MHTLYWLHTMNENNLLLQRHTKPTKPNNNQLRTNWNGRKHSAFYLNMNRGNGKKTFNWHPLHIKTHTSVQYSKAIRAEVVSNNNIDTMTQCKREKRKRKTLLCYVLQLNGLLILSIHWWNTFWFDACDLWLSVDNILVHFSEFFSKLPQLKIDPH